MNRIPWRFSQMAHLMLALSLLVNSFMVLLPPGFSALAAAAVASYGDSTALASSSSKVTGNLQSQLQALAASPTCTQTTPLTSTLTYLSPISTSYASALPLAALLTDQSGNPLISRGLTFTVGSQTAAAQTDANGVAKTSLLPTAAPGTVTATVAFGGDTTYPLTQLTQPITITKQPTYLT